MATKLYNPDKDYLLEHLAEETHILAESASFLRERYKADKPKGETVRILGNKVSADDAYDLVLYLEEKEYFYAAGAILESLEKEKYPKAFLAMAELCRRGLGVVLDVDMAGELEKKAFSIWEERAAKGDAQALFDLGICYRRGEGVPQDNSKAVEYYILAYEKGCSEAALNLGLMYGEGLGVKQDFEKAYELYKVAAEYGIADGYTLMGRQHYYGLGREVNYGEAIKLFLKAAESDEGDALYHLGLCYVNGNGVEQDNEKAIECFYRSADAGTREAEEVLKENGFQYPLEDNDEE